MKLRDKITRYSLIINLVRRRTPTFDDIADYLEQEAEIRGEPNRISKRTFQRDLEDIRELFNIDIQYNAHRKGYFIAYEDRSVFNERILETFDIFNALHLAGRHSHHIHFEARKPQGTENLRVLLQSIEKQVQIQFTHQKFWEDAATHRTVEPYALKEFRNRWYILGQDMKDQRVKSFALDRVSGLDITRRKFEKPADFDVNKHYEHCFGIISPNEGQPEEVILKFTPFQGKYIKTLPLHNTQEALVDNDQEYRIRLTIHLTHDFFMELLSYGPNVKVIKPEHLKAQVRKSLEEALEGY